MSNTHIKLILAIQNNNCHEVLTCLQHAHHPDEMIVGDIPLYEYLCKLPLGSIVQLINQLPTFFTDHVIARMILHILADICYENPTIKLYAKDLEVIIQLIKYPPITHYLFTHLVTSKNIDSNSISLLIKTIGIDQFVKYTDQNNYIFIIKTLYSVIGFESFSSRRLSTRRDKA